MAINAAGKAFAKWSAKAGAKQLAGSSVPAWGNAVMAIWSAVDGAMAIGDVNEIKKVARESLEKLDVLKSKINDLKNLADGFKDFDKLPANEQLQKARELGTADQDILATMNACTRARKCNLVPYSKNDNKRKVEPANKGGCCPGQTGHHIIPKASIKDSCPKYDHSLAPVVCAEGASQHFGSHKRIHTQLANVHRGFARSNNNKIGSDGTMSLDDAITAGVRSHQRAFSTSRCSTKCSEAQLKNHYKDVCPGARPKMLDASGKPITPAAAGIKPK